jgi:carbon storage regulator
MLVLRRRAGESVFIGDDIEIEFLAVTAQGAKIGIHAPRETVILRKELKVTQQQNQRAARAVPPEELDHALKKLRVLTQELNPRPDKPNES